MQLAAAGCIGATKYIFKEIQNFGEVYRHIYIYIYISIRSAIVFNGSALITVVIPLRQFGSRHLFRC